MFAAVCILPWCACVRACVILVSWFTLQTISDGYAMLRAAFPGKLIIPSIGNCETFPDYQIGCGADRSRPDRTQVSS